MVTVAHYGGDKTRVSETNALELGLLKKELKTKLV